MACIKKQSKKKINKLFELSIGHAYWKDKDGVYLGCNDNQAKALGYQSGQEIVGKTDFDLPWRKQAALLRKSDLEVMASKKELLVEEIVNIHGAKESRVFLSKKMPLECDGKVVGILGVSIDVTERKAAEKLQQEKKAAEKIIATIQAISGCISHEMRTPLAIVNLYVDVLKSFLTENKFSLVKKQELEKIIATIKCAVTSGSYNIDMLLGKLQLLINTQNNKKDNFLNCTLIPIGNLVASFLGKYPFVDNERDLIFYDHIISNNFYCLADSKALEQVLANLIKNALWAIKGAEKGKIYISLKQGIKYNELVFKDTASGISSQFLNTIFEPFTANRKNGSGLGLFFCKTIMNALSGDIKCSSQEGEYAEFVLSFPVVN